MTDQKFYERQPDVLPLTLPAGTRFECCPGYLMVFTGEARLTHSRDYNGDCRSIDGRGLDFDESAVEPACVDWTSVPLPEPADRPIQAGDWVECVDADSALTHLTLGHRYQVVELSGRELVFEAGGLYWYASRFKCVDGPHVEAMAPTSPVPPPRPLTPGNTGDCLLCGAACGYAHKPGCPAKPTASATPKRDPYTEHRLTVEPDSACLRDPKPEALAARARLAAWERSEQPRVANRAERKQLAAGHPSGWPSNEGEE
jgi:hypothetical protein